MKKPSVNIHRKRNVVIAVIVDNDNRILLTKKHQPDSEFLHGKWQLPGLGMKLDETYKETLKRLQETFSIEFAVQTTDPIESISYRNKNAYTILHIFAGEYICHPEQSEGSRNVFANLHTQESLHPVYPDIVEGLQNDNVTWLPYQDLNPEDCTPLTMEIIEIALKS